ncbi:hypothetical protein N7481_009150 [Penicillium waksmanii]|uniref:uncharacterized protein n=1 Tax=Penicillium waksmanii TaxID=69791 RepID=UPI0025490F64|nr:uncharacterized protein N7481_009150 [Penicillium waksmanii]KAJ5975443.1 hypothetical protein N7481_009150 [Penicillium waksmanii]
MKIIQGVASDNSSSVRVFRGVPYAEPPLGELRFRPPVTKRPVSGIIDATKYKDICPIWNQGGPSIYSEYITGDQPYPYLDQGEDCLHLNIWTPINATYHSNLTVMIWVHGGGNTGGNAAQPFKEGTFIAQNQNVIVVSLDYRLNIFGYPGYVPAFGGRNLNPGLLDIRKAVEWTYTYIKYFGGDPESMVLFGQSAGGANVDYYTYAWSTDPLVKGFISESGVASSFGNFDLPGNNWTYVADHFNCTGNQDQQLSCLQEVPWRDLIDLSYSYNSTLNGGKTLSFGPQPDNQTIFSNYKDLRRRGQYAKGGYLTGNNANEGESLITPFSETSGPNQTLVYIQSDLLFNCASNSSATERSENETPQWRYYYRGVWPNQNPFPWLGSYHSSEIPQIWGTAETWGGNKLGGPNTPEEAAFSRYIQRAWAIFAKDPMNGLSTLGWPKYNVNEETLIQLAYNGSTIPQFVSPMVADQNCTLPGHSA